MDLQTSAVCRLALVIRLRAETGRGSLDYTVIEFLGCTKCEEIPGHMRDCDVLEEASDIEFIFYEGVGLLGTPLAGRLKIRCCRLVLFRVPRVRLWNPTLPGVDTEAYNEIWRFLDIAGPPRELNLVAMRF